MRIDQVLFEYGQAVQPMRSAPRDGTRILGSPEIAGRLSVIGTNDRLVWQDPRGWKNMTLGSAAPR